MKISAWLQTGLGHVYVRFCRVADIFTVSPCNNNMVQAIIALLMHIGSFGCQNRTILRLNARPSPWRTSQGPKELCHLQPRCYHRWSLHHQVQPRLILIGPQPIVQTRRQSLRSRQRSICNRVECGELPRCLPRQPSQGIWQQRAHRIPR